MDATSLDRRLLRALVRDVVPLCFAGYVVLVLIAFLYFVFSTQGFSVVVDAASGGAFLAFALAPPLYVGIGYAVAVWKKRALLHPAPQEEVPAANEEVPARPAPEPEQQVPADPESRDVAEHVAQPRVAEHVAPGRPQDEGPEDKGPSGDAEHGGEHRRRTYRRHRIGVAGWVVILAGAFAWEMLSLADPNIQTLSHLMRITMEPVIGRIAMVGIWIGFGFALFGPRIRASRD